MKLRRCAWWLGAAVGVAVLVMGVVMLRAGLEKADQLGSVIGSLTGIAGLGVAVFALIVAIRPVRHDTESNHGSASGAGPTNSVNNSTIQGSNVQIGRADGDVRIERDT